jgi:UrcA family protein
MLKAIRYAIAFAALCCMQNELFAQSAPEAPAAVATATVRYGDLDLNTREGVATLYGRLKAATRVVCRDYESGELYLVYLAKSCREDALAAAVRSVGHDTLDALHRTSIASTARVRARRLPG